MNRVSFHVFVIIISILIQVLVTNNVFLFGYLNPMIYILFVFLIPLNLNKYYLLIISFLVGLIIDIFSDSGGIHASATLAIAYFRLPILNLIQNNIEFDQILFNVKKLNFLQVIVYIFSLIFIHHSIVYTLEFYKTGNFTSIFYKIFQATLFSGIIISFFLQLLIKDKRL